MDELIRRILDGTANWAPIPVPNILAFFFVVLFLYPLLRKAHKEIASIVHGDQAPPAAPPVSSTQVESGWLYSILHEMDAKIADTNRRLELIEALLRRRQRLNKS